MPLLLPLGAGGTAGPVYIRRGGAYVRYDGKMAIDKELCDCSCEDPPPVCCCDDLPSTMNARALVLGYSDCDPLTPDEQEVFFSVTRAECEAMFEDGPIPIPLTECVSGVHCGEFTSWQCTIGGVFYEATHQVILRCVKSSAGSSGMSFEVWSRRELAPGSYASWQSIASGELDCPVTTIGDAGWTPALPGLSFKELEFWV